MHKCINNSIGNVYHLEQFVSDFFPYSQEQLGFDKPATIRFESDQDNAGVMLGKTAYYDPDAMEVVLYIDGRHPKDVMRSLSHELVHHAQNCRGDFTTQDNTDAGYAQSNPHLRKMEREAYTKGNLIFRDYEDLIKTGKKEVDIDFTESGEPKMSLKEWKNNEINTKLMKKWGFLKESKAEEMEQARREEEMNEGGSGDELEEGHEHGPECGCPDMEEGMQYRVDDGWGKSPAAFTGTEKEEEEATSHLKKGKALEEDSEGEETYHYGEAEGHDEKELHDLVRRHATRSHIDALKRDMDYDEDHEDRHERGDHFREAKDIEERFSFSDRRQREMDAEDRAIHQLDPSSHDRLEFEEDPSAMEREPVTGKIHGQPKLGPSVRWKKGSKYTTKDEDPTSYGLPRDIKKHQADFASQFKEGKISVREAKQITRRIIERIRKEGN